MNQPYVKQLNGKGQVVNLITKDNPYLNYYENRSSKKLKIRNQRHRGNNKGYAIVIVGTMKYFKSLQVIPVFIKGIFKGNRVIEHSLTK